MVLLRTGGVYADIDVECMQPLDKLIQPTDTLVVGWEGELPSPSATSDPVVAAAALVDGAEEVQQQAGDTGGDTAITGQAAAATPSATAAADSGAPRGASSSHNATHAAPRQHYARRRQLLQWFFAAAPGHPALRELCDHVARNAMNSFSNDTVRDTLERTGQGVWTDVVLRHAIKQVTGQVRRCAEGILRADNGTRGPHHAAVLHTAGVKKCALPAQAMSCIDWLQAQ
jgi:mannosyltransferase OCH1-like enzyme